MRHETLTKCSYRTHLPSHQVIPSLSKLTTLQSDPSSNQTLLISSLDLPLTLYSEWDSPVFCKMTNNYAFFFLLIELHDSETKLRYSIMVLNIAMFSNKL